MRTDTRRRALQRALEIVGGHSALCARLGISDRSLQFWLEGHGKVSDKVFLAVVDLIVDDDMHRAMQDRRTQPRAVIAAAAND